MIIMAGCADRTGGTIIIGHAASDCTDRARGGERAHGGRQAKALRAARRETVTRAAHVLAVGHGEREVGAAARPGHARLRWCHRDTLDKHL